MAGKIFINYRRDDSIATAGRLHDRLAEEFGRKNVFMDVDHIPAGVDFHAHLDTQVAACDVFLVIIGLAWLTAADETGHRRIENTEDFVMVEIAAALARNIRVIPVLVDGARMPRADELPEVLRPLARRNAVEVRNTQFGGDVQRLIEKMREALRGEAGSRWWMGALAAVLLGLVGGLLYAWPPISWQAPTKKASIQSPTGSAQYSRIRLRQAILLRASALDWNWIEKDPRNNKEVTFPFRQIASTPTELTLHDANRDMYARLNFGDRRAYWRIGTQGPWQWNYDILEVE